MRGGALNSDCEQPYLDFDLDSPQEQLASGAIRYVIASGPQAGRATMRLHVDGDGLVMLELKRAFTDGTTHVLFEPEDFIARLAALVPRPRAHLLRYHGLFAPNAPQAPSHR